VLVFGVFVLIGGGVEVIFWMGVGVVVGVFCFCLFWGVGGRGGFFGIGGWWGVVVEWSVFLGFFVGFQLGLGCGRGCGGGLGGGGLGLFFLGCWVVGNRSGGTAIRKGEGGLEGRREERMNVTIAHKGLSHKRKSALGKEGRLKPRTRRGVTESSSTRKRRREGSRVFEGRKAYTLQATQEKDKGGEGGEGPLPLGSISMRVSRKKWRTGGAQKKNFLC